MTTKEEIKERIRIMQAWVDGEEIVFSTAAGGSTTTGGMTFDFIRNQYRIKPQPKEIWVDGNELIFNSPEDACSHWGYNKELTKYREVLADD